MSNRHNEDVGVDEDYVVDDRKTDGIQRFYDDDEDEYYDEDDYEDYDYEDDLEDMDFYRSVQNNAAATQPLTPSYGLVICLKNS